MIIFDHDSLIQMCGAAATSAQLPGSHLNGIPNNGHHLPDLGFNGSKNNGSSFLSSSGNSKDTYNNPDPAHLLRDILQAGRKFSVQLANAVGNTTNSKLGQPLKENASSDQPNSPGESGKQIQAGGVSLRGNQSSQCSDASDAEEEDLDSSRDEDGYPVGGLTVTDPNVTASNTGSGPSQEGATSKLSVISASGSRSSSPSNAFGSSTSAPSGTQTESRPTVQNNGNNNILSGNSSTSIDVKKARVENIVSNMLLGGSSNTTDNQVVTESSLTEKPTADPTNNSLTSTDNSSNLPVNGCKKRKLYQPQQSKLTGPPEEEDIDDDLTAIDSEDMNEEDTLNDDEDLVSEITDLSSKRIKICEIESNEDKPTALREQLEDMQAQLFIMRQRYVKLFEHQQQQLNQQQLANNPTRHRNSVNSPVNLTTGTSPERVDEDLDETEIIDENSDKDDTETPVSQISDITNRDTSRVSSNQTGLNPRIVANNSIQDPEAFLDEARRILNEHGKETCNKLSGSTNNLPQFMVSTPSSAMIQPNANDLDWLIESLKNEIQSNVLRIIDSIFARYIQRKNQQNHVSPVKLDDSMTSGPPNVLLSKILSDTKSPRTGKDSPRVIDRGASANVSVMGNQNKPNCQPSRGSPFSLPPDNTQIAKLPGSTPMFPFTPGASFPKPYLFPGSHPAHQFGLQHFTNFASIFNPHQAVTKRDIPREPSPNLPHQKEIASNYKVNSKDQIIGNGLLPNSSTTPNSCNDQPEQDQPLPLVVTPRKKRSKVTDNPRVNPRSGGRMLGHDSIIGPFGRDLHSTSPPPSFSHGPSAPPPPLVPVPPTSMATINPGLHPSDIFGGSAFPFPNPGFFGPARDVMDDNEEREKNNYMSALAAQHLASLANSLNNPRQSPDESLGYSGIYGKYGSDNGNDNESDASLNGNSTYDGTMPLTSTLTPMHLRKAKLMFFYVRYPSSAILKMFFPDIKFNKNNTAQLVKWFSNFREFYYIQMEKYARQFQSEGVKNIDDLNVNHDSELLRVLNLHYNRNNHIDVPENFRYVVEQTLREFFKAIVAQKDTEQSWKKAIYKIIARLDDNVPEYFKSPNFLEQLDNNFAIN